MFAKGGGVWCLRQESNLYLALRRHSFYPLNYGGGNGILQARYVACHLMEKDPLFAHHAHGIFQTFEG